MFRVGLTFLFRKFDGQNYFMKRKGKSCTQLFERLQKCTGTKKLYLGFQLSLFSVVALKSNNEERIEQLIKKGKISLSKKESPKIVESYFVQALHIAIGNEDRKVVARVQDLLANLALQTNELDKAEKLFRNVLQNLILTGTKETDNSIIEISLKLASIYAQKGQQELALTGYEWCIRVARQNIKDKKEDFNDKDYINTFAILGMILDSYGRYLSDINKHQESLTCTFEALGICQKIFGEDDPRTLVLFNDIATIKLYEGEINEALTFALKAVERSSDPNDKCVFLANLSHIYMQLGDEENATKTFKESLIEVSKTSDHDLKEKIASLIHNIPPGNKNKS